MFQDTVLAGLCGPGNNHFNNVITTMMQVISTPVPVIWGIELFVYGIFIFRMKDMSIPEGVDDFFNQIREGDWFDILKDWIVLLLIIVFTGVAASAGICP